MVFADRFAGKVMVVTGAAQGIGAGVASRAAAEGASLVLVDRAEIVTETEAAIRAAGGTAISVQCDLETHAGAVQAMTAAVEAFGRIDVLVNNVGGSAAGGPVQAQVRVGLEHLDCTLGDRRRNVAPSSRFNVFLEVKPDTRNHYPRIALAFIGKRIVPFLRSGLEASGKQFF